MIHELLDKRWSPRAFDPSRKVEAEKLHNIFEAVRRAPSSSNEQPWRLMLGVKDEGPNWENIFSTLTDGNKIWVKTVPVLVMTFAKKTFTRNGKPNPHYWHDIGQAASHLTFQAMAEGLYVHQMAGFSKEKAIEVFKSPEDFEPVTVIAIGYKGDANQLPEEKRADEQQKIIRKPLEEIIIDKWVNE